MMTNIWSQELLICQGVSADSMPWKHLKTDGNILLICTHLGHKFFQVAGSKKISIYTRYRVMFLDNIWRNKIQIFNKIYFLQPTEIKERKYLDSCLVTFGYSIPSTSLFIMEDGILYCTKENKDSNLETINKICDIKEIEYNKFNDKFCN